MLKKTHSYLRQAAFSLTEVAMVLLVVGVISAGIWTAIDAVQSNLRVSETSKGILSTCSNMRRVFPANMAAAGTGTTNILAATKATQVFPADWKNTGSSVTVPIGIVYNVLQYNLDEVQSNGALIGGGISIIINKIKNSESRKFVAAFNTAKTSRDTLVQFSIGGDNYSSLYHYVLPQTADLTGACGSHTLNLVAVVCAP